MSYLDILNNSQKSLSDENLLWICDLIRKYQPTNILEVGVSTGGSTAVYLNCIKDMPNTRLTSIDINDIAFYKEGKPAIGSEVFKVKDQLDLSRFTLKTKFITAELDDEKFDFIILDTEHFVPGEILDVLCLKNNIEKGTIIVLDDINIESRYPNLYKYNLKSTSCNSLLLASICGTIILPDTDIPEIGAIQVESIDENKLLLCLCHKWNTDNCDIRYVNKIRKLYGEEFYNRFEKIYQAYRYSNFVGK